MDRRALLVVAVLLAVVVSLLGLGAHPVPDRPRAVPTATVSWSPLPEPSATPTRDDPRQSPGEDLRKPPQELPPWLAATLNAVAVLVAAVVVGLVVRQLARLRLTRLPTGAVGAREGEVRELSEADAEELREEFVATLARLRAGGDVQDAVLRCWLVVEDVAARQGVARRPSQTAEEFTLEVVAGTRARREDMRTLADLYRAAMFSARPADDADRAAAVSTLERLVADMERTSAGPVTTVPGAAAAAEPTEDRRG